MEAVRLRQVAPLLEEEGLWGCPKWATWQSLMQPQVGRNAGRRLGRRAGQKSRSTWQDLQHMQIRSQL
jgi:hypothetical protein